MEKPEIIEKIKQAKEISKPRKFKQTWDFSVVLKGINLKKPENRFSSDFTLPHGRGKDVKIAVIADTMANEAKKVVDTVITKDEIEKLAKNKKKLKKLVDEHIFLCEVSLMPLVGKTMGIVMGPRGKMPRPVPPKMKIEPFVMSAKRTVRIALKETPVINVVVGSEDMPEENVAANAEAVYNHIKDKLPKGATNIRSAYLKLTMGKPMKFEVR